MIKKIDFYILKGFIPLFLFFFFVTLFIFTLTFFFAFMDELFGKGLPVSIIAEFIFYASLRLYPTAFQISILLGSLILIGTLGEKYELVALRSLGISFFRIIRPLVIFILLFSVAMFIFEDQIMPWSNIKFRAKFSTIRQKKADFALKKGVFNTDLDNYTIKVENKIGEGEYEDILIYDHTDNNGNNNVTIAERCKFSFDENSDLLIVNVYKGRNYYDKEGTVNTTSNTFLHTITSFDSQTVYIDMSKFKLGLADEELFKSSFSSLSTSELIFVKDSLSKIFNPTFSSVTGLILSKYKVDTTLKLNDSMIPNYFLKEKFWNFNDSFISREKIIMSAIYGVDEIISIYNNNSPLINENQKLLMDFDIEWIRKITETLACILLLLLGTSLGSIIRKGGLGLPLVVGSISFIIYYILHLTGIKLARELSSTSISGLSLPLNILAPFVLILTFLSNFKENLLNWGNILNYYFKFKFYFQKKINNIKKLKNIKKNKL